MKVLLRVIIYKWEKEKNMETRLEGHVLTVKQGYIGEWKENAN